MATESGRLFKEYREKSNRTQREVAEILGYNQEKIISNIERGMCLIPAYLLKDYAKSVRGSIRDLTQAWMKDKLLREKKKIERSSVKRKIFAETKKALEKTKWGKLEVKPTEKNIKLTQEFHKAFQAEIDELK
jgi:transcriptional regulator with XRE-family HTH domain